MVDHYQVLGMGRNATKEEIKEAFWKLTIKYHPDKQVLEAYDVLSDDRKHAFYNNTANSDFYRHANKIYSNHNGSGYGYGYSARNQNTSSFQSAFESTARYLTKIEIRECRKGIRVSKRSSGGGKGRDDGVLDGGYATDNEDVNQFFLPYRGICARKGIKMVEVVLDDDDAARALLDYVNKNYISNIVLGSSTKSSFARSLKFSKSHDVKTTLLRLAPEFCSVYVISKGKVQAARPAPRPIKNTISPPKVPSARPYHEQVDGVRGQRSSRSNESESLSHDNAVKGESRDRHKSPTKIRLDLTYNAQFRNQNNSRKPSDDSDIGSVMGSLDFTALNFDSPVEHGSSDESLPQSAKDIEAEMRRLKLELKQTMKMYSSACKEALAAKNKANELHQWKMEEARKFEEARLSEEAALAIVEVEKAKCKAAIEAAEKAQRLAKLEAHRRKQAEKHAVRETERKDRALSALAGNDVRYRKYTIEEIEEGTQRFTELNKIGEGGYGPVYKGVLDHTNVAIKVLRPGAAQGKKQFQQEVEVLSSIRHPNMVLLLGACPEYGCLVYEYMENGSLEDRLFCRGKSLPLSWRQRFQIAAEIATALLFLHQGKPEPLVHRDLKPANILLDRNYVSKISDVGLARLVPASVADSVTQYYMTSAAGTFCYIDPEYQQTGMLTTKSDIYSLGILLLQIITAKPPMGVAHHVSRAIERGTIAKTLDPAVQDWPVEEALAFAKLALKCVELRKKDRPDLGRVIVPELNRLRDFGIGSG